VDAAQGKETFERESRKRYRKKFPGEAVKRVKAVKNRLKKETFSKKTQAQAAQNDKADIRETIRTGVERKSHSLGEKGGERDSILSKRN